MPPQTPRVSTGSWHSVLYFLFGFVVGAVVAIPSFMAFLTSSAGISTVTRYLSAPPPLPEVTAEQSASTTQLLSEVANGSLGIPVPKGSASAAYATALNNTVRDITVIAASSTELSVVLTQIQNQSLSRNYNGIIDLVVSAKSILAVQKVRLSAFSSDLTALSAANQSTSDATAKATTLDLVAKGTALQASLETLMSSLDNLLSGTPPTTQQVLDIEAQSQTATAQASDFIDLIKSLKQHFGISQ